MMPAIEVQHLTKNFARFRAVDDISFSVEPGEIFGFLGANGAGKTTTIRMLCGILAPSGGKARVAGFDIAEESDEIKKRIGYMSQKFSLYDDLTVGENITFFGGIYRLSKAQLKERAAWAIEMAGLQGCEKQITSTLAGGFKQRLALGCALLHEPQVLFLDEPTAGIDPESRTQFWQLIRQMAALGVTVLVTTHYMDEAEHCARLTLMDRGRIIAEGSPAQLKQNALSGKMYEVIAAPFEKVQKLLIAYDEQGYVEPFGIKFHVLDRQQRPDFGATLTQYLAEAGVAIEAIKTLAPSLEDVFLALIGSSINKAKGI